jgi:hypothetical protein
MCGSSCECGACKAVRVVVSLLLLLTTIASFLGLWRDHMTAAGWSFGSGDQSLSLLVFIVSLLALYKTSKKLCPCSSGCCGKCGNCPCTCNKDMGGMKK